MSFMRRIPQFIFASFLESPPSEARLLPSGETGKTPFHPNKDTPLSWQGGVPLLERNLRRS
jgi:hypothetical protein